MSNGEGKSAAKSGGFAGQHGSVHRIHAGSCCSEGEYVGPSATPQTCGATQGREQEGLCISSQGGHPAEVDRSQAG